MTTLRTRALLRASIARLEPLSRSAVVERNNARIRWEAGLGEDGAGDELDGERGKARPGYENPDREG